METHRIKRIIIIILALVNAVLLLMFALRQLQTRSQQKAEFSQLQKLYERNGIALRVPALSHTELPASAAVQQNTEAEEAFIAALLGENLMREESGSSTSYTSPDGSTARLRRNGALEVRFSILRLSYDSADAALQPFGYRLSPLTLNTSSCTATQYIDDRALLGAQLSLRFEDGLLSSLDGYYVNSMRGSQEVLTLSDADALTRFLRYTQSQGIVCSGVDRIDQAWLFSSSTLFQSSLSPVLLIHTDTAQYFVNPQTQEVSVLPDVFA